MDNSKTTTQPKAVVKVAKVKKVRKPNINFVISPKGADAKVADLVKAYNQKNVAFFLATKTKESAEKLVTLKKAKYSDYTKLRSILKNKIDFTKEAPSYVNFAEIVKVAAVA